MSVQLGTVVRVSPGWASVQSHDAHDIYLKDVSTKRQDEINFHFSYGSARKFQGAFWGTLSALHEVAFLPSMLPKTPVRVRMKRENLQGSTKTLDTSWRRLRGELPALEQKGRAEEMQDTETVFGNGCACVTTPYRRLVYVRSACSLRFSEIERLFADCKNQASLFSVVRRQCWDDKTPLHDPVVIEINRWQFANTTVKTLKAPWPQVRRTLKRGQGRYNVVALPVTGSA